MNNLTIPSKERVEWKHIVTGVIQHDYRNYVLQMKIHQAQKDVASKKISTDEAVGQLYDLCSKYAFAVQYDFKTIFKTW